jgi:chloramphenicol O-acetyltransferase
VVETFKKQNSEYKVKLVTIQDDFDKKEQEYLEAIEQLKSQIRMLRKDQSEKENELYEFK